MSERIDINRADIESLSEIKGIGPNLAARIINYRETVHPFEEVIELVAVPGISERMVRQFQHLVTVDFVAEPSDSWDEIVENVISSDTMENNDTTEMANEDAEDALDEAIAVASLADEAKKDALAQVETIAELGEEVRNDAVAQAAAIETEAEEAKAEAWANVKLAVAVGEEEHAAALSEAIAVEEKAEEATAEALENAIAAEAEIEVAETEALEAAVIVEEMAEEATTDALETVIEAEAELEVVETEALEAAVVVEEKAEEATIDALEPVIEAEAEIEVAETEALEAALIAAVSPLVASRTETETKIFNGETVKNMENKDRMDGHEPPMNNQPAQVQPNSPWGAALAGALMGTLLTLFILAAWNSWNLKFVNQSNLNTVQRQVEQDVSLVEQSQQELSNDLNSLTTNLGLVGGQVDELNNSVEDRFNSVSTHLSAVDSHLTAVDDNLTTIDEELATLDANTGEIKTRLDGVEEAAGKTTGFLVGMRDSLLTIFGLPPIAEPEIMSPTITLTNSVGISPTITDTISLTDTTTISNSVELTGTMIITESGTVDEGYQPVPTATPIFTPATDEN